MKSMNFFDDFNFANGYNEQWCPYSRPLQSDLIEEQKKHLTDTHISFGDDTLKLSILRILLIWKMLLMKNIIIYDLKIGK